MHDDDLQKQNDEQNSNNYKKKKYNLNTSINKKQLELNKQTRSVSEKAST